MTVYYTSITKDHVLPDVLLATGPDEHPPAVTHSVLEVTAVSAACHQSYVQWRSNVCIVDSSRVLHCARMTDSRRALHQATERENARELPSKQEVVGSKPIGAK